MRITIMILKNEVLMLIECDLTYPNKAGWVRAFSNMKKSLRERPPHHSVRLSILLGGYKQPSTYSTEGSIPPLIEVTLPSTASITIAFFPFTVLETR